MTVTDFGIVDSLAAAKEHIAGLKGRNPGMQFGHQDLGDGKFRVVARNPVEAEENPGSYASYYPVTVDFQTRDVVDREGIHDKMFRNFMVMANRIWDATNALDVKFAKGDVLAVGKHHARVVFKVFSEEPPSRDIVRQIAQRELIDIYGSPTHLFTPPVGRIIEVFVGGAVARSNPPERHPSNRTDWIRVHRTAWKYEDENAHYVVRLGVKGDVDWWYLDYGKGDRTTIDDHPDEIVEGQSARDYLIGSAALHYDSLDVLENPREYISRPLADPDDPFPWRKKKPGRKPLVDYPHLWEDPSWPEGNPGVRGRIVVDKKIPYLEVRMVLTTPEVRINRFRIYPPSAARFEGEWASWGAGNTVKIDHPDSWNLGPWRTVEDSTPVILPLIPPKSKYRVKWSEFEGKWRIEAPRPKWKEPDVWAVPSPPFISNPRRKKRYPVDAPMIQSLIGPISAANLMPGVPIMVHGMEVEFMDFDGDMIAYRDAEGRIKKIMASAVAMPYNNPRQIIKDIDNPRLKKARNIYEDFWLGKEPTKVSSRKISLPGGDEPLIYLGDLAGIIYASDKEDTTQGADQLYYHELSNPYPKIYCTEDKKSIIIPLQGGGMRIADGWLRERDE